MNNEEASSCPHEYHTRFPPCIILRVNKYSYLSDFIIDFSSKKDDLSIALKIDCIEFLNDHINIKNDNCINCMFCVFGCPGNNIEVKNDLTLRAMCSNFKIDYDNKLGISFIDSLFNGSFITLPSIRLRQFKIKYKSFEEFNEKDETTNISVWGANILKYLSISKSPRIALEVGMKINKRDRGGRLDICMLNNQLLFVAEAKISFDKMMKENRYIHQLLAYEEELLAATKDTNISYYKFLLIGGPESDLLPQNHPECTSKVGNRANMFYNSVISNNFYFISANAFLSLGLLKLFKGDDYSLENIADLLFKSGNIGLLSCGIVNNQNHKITIEKFI